MNRCKGMGQDGDIVLLIRPLQRRRNFIPNDNPQLLSFLILPLACFIFQVFKQAEPCPKLLDQLDTRVGDAICKYATEAALTPSTLL